MPSSDTQQILETLFSTVTAFVRFTGPPKAFMSILEALGTRGFAAECVKMDYKSVIVRTHGQDLTGLIKNLAVLILKPSRWKFGNRFCLCFSWPCFFNRLSVSVYIYIDRLIDWFDWVSEWVSEWLSECSSIDQLIDRLVKSIVSLFSSSSGHSVWQTSILRNIPGSFEICGLGLRLFWR